MKEYTRVFLEEVRLEVRIGFFEEEKQDPSPLCVTVELFCEQTGWPDPQLSNIVDYNRVYTYLQSWRERPHTDLLETLAEDLLGYCFADRRVAFCKVKLAKTGFYGDTGGAGIEIARSRPLHT
jgi:dihydroneopterin aldolase